MDTIKTIYLVDDDPDDRLFIRQAMQQAQPGLEVIEAASGFELLTLIEQEKQGSAALILMDMNMPRMSGLETIQALRADHTLPHIPVVMISTTSNPSYIKSAYEAGVAGFICKPVTLKGFTDMAQQVSTYLEG